MTIHSNILPAIVPAFDSSVPFCCAGSLQRKEDVCKLILYPSYIVDNMTLIQQ